MEWTRRECRCGSGGQREDRGYPHLRKDRRHQGSIGLGSNRTARREEFRVRQAGEHHRLGLRGGRSRNRLGEREDQAAQPSGWRTRRCDGRRVGSHGRSRTLHHRNAAIAPARQGRRGQRADPVDDAQLRAVHAHDQEAPSKAIRTSGLVPGLPPGTAIPADLGPLGTVQSLQEGIPVTYTSPDGNTTTITPNPDGTRTVAQSFTGPDGSTTTTTSVNGAPPTTTVTTTRPDGSGIVDSTITGPDGKTQRVQTVPKGQGKSTTYAVNPDGSLGAQLSESYPAPNGGVITDVPGPNGELDRQWVRPDGFRAFEQYVVGPDGQQHLAGTSNSAGMNSVMNPDGTIKTTFADGRTAQTGQLADGRIVTQFEDGSVLGYDPEKAVPGTPKQSTWDVVKTWTGGQWDGMYSSTVGTVDAHPVATGAGLVRVRSASGPPAPVERWPRTQQLRQVDRRNSRHAPSTCSILAHRVLGGRWSIRWTPQPMPRRGRRLPTS